MRTRCSLRNCCTTGRTRFPSPLFYHFDRLIRNGHMDVTFLSLPDPPVSAGSPLFILITVLDIIMILSHLPFHPVVPQF
ncbi:hypothetical protein PISMIDRAFT_680580 [Pisolithus microcarpus 441]|uniref:Uncharacterized protein n=1 Tax=Pisolithus microcarpus 441 TaxID=765257 RepID=A0A0C9YZN1_9AGAM|nr:hypothetical protein BKA83DRAFT_680580 [Pisolithus microcarpus]KIK22241.1 hypothetical protein PISMIDRAFT_680580 [Pisolithus microcarpus 441]